jgi:hypothetical protein
VLRGAGGALPAALIASVIAALLAACSSSDAGESEPPRSIRAAATTTTTTAPAPPSTTTTLAAPTTTTTPPQFRANVLPIDPTTAQRMTGVSWRPGCPVGLDGLRLLRLTHHGFDGAVHEGELVVSTMWADRIVEVFRQLFAAGYPIERMQLVDDFGASDDASVLANNTSAFNCRAVTGGSGWSRHAYGTAIDLNPRQNPYVYPDGHLLDPASEPFRDRRGTHPAMIHQGDAVFAAFSAIGWRWGGFFSDTPDPQHFDTR